MNSIFTLPLFIPFCFFIFGAILGSFLNVVIYRLPLKKSVVAPRSTCACGKLIPFYLNIPILSWIILMGKAACCKASISIQYILVEIITSVLFFLLWFLFDAKVAICGMLFFSILIVATFIDIRHMIIPNILSIGGVFLGVFISCLIPEIHGFCANTLQDHCYSFLSSILGIIVGTSLVYWISTIGELILKKPAMGEGDMKFLAAIGAFTGWQGAFFSLFGGALIGSCLILPYLMYMKIKSPNEPRIELVPFGPFLALGGILHFLFLEEYVRSYFDKIAWIFT